MIFGIIFTFSEKHFRNQFKNRPLKTLGAPGAVHPQALVARVRRSTGPTRQSHIPGGLTGRDLTVGEVIGGEVFTLALYFVRRT
jgi:hypothetical protein